MGRNNKQKAKRRAARRRENSKGNSKSVVRAVVGCVLLVAVAMASYFIWKSNSTPSPAQPSASDQGAGPIATIPAPVQASDEGPVRRPDLATRAAIVPGGNIKPLADNPAQEGWDTEVFGSAVSRQLAKIIKLLGQPTSPEVKLGTIVSENCSIGRLRPERLTETFRDQAFVVRHASAKSANDQEQGYTGGFGFSTALAELLSPLSGASDVHGKFKVVRVTPALEQTSTVAYFQISGQAAAGNVQINATWHMTWNHDRVLRNRVPRMTSLRVTDYEEVIGLNSNTPMFADCTEAILGGNRVFDQQLRPGVDHWLGILDMKFGADVGGWQGISIGDVNGDGLDDIYVCQPGGLPNRLFVQKPDGTAEDISDVAGVDLLDSTHGALFVDLDNDGDQDLLVSVARGVIAMGNDGQGRFSPHATMLLPAATAYSLCAADYDLDGDLDIFVCCYNRRSDANRHIDFARPVPYQDANNGGRNVLLRNDISSGDPSSPESLSSPNEKWRFTHVTKQVGLDQNNRRFSYAASWDDYDNDGDLDLYVANDFGRNNLYRNDQGTFTDVAPAAGVEDISPGMSAVWGDYDNDGRVDLYVSNMFSSAGNRITFQQQFLGTTDATTLAEFQRHARGNSLFKNLGDGTFEDVSQQAKVTMGRWAWGSRFVDLNNDGWNDLLVANGFITQNDSGDL